MSGPDMRGLRILLAARLSQMHGKETGLDSQDAEFRRWAEAQGAVIVHVAEDKKSGTSAPWDRKNLKPWVTELHLMDRYDAVGAFKLDRLSRGDDETTTRIEGWARANGKWLITAEGDYYPCEGNDGITWDVKKRIAHQEWLAASERYKRAQKYLRDNGFWAHGRAPYGFRLVEAEGSDHKIVEADPTTAPFVVEAVDRYLAGDSLRAVCAWLDSSGSKPWRAEKWWPIGLRDLFCNPILMGRVSDRKGKTLMRIEPIISPDKWHELQAAMKSRARGTNHRPRAELLSGIAECPVCRRNMGYHVSRRTRVDGSVRQLDYYRCHGTDHDRSKCRNMVRADWLESMVDWTMSSTEPGTHGAEKLKHVASIPHDGRQEDIAEIDREITRLDPDDDEWMATVTALREKRDTIKADIKTHPAPDEIIERDTGLTMAGLWPRLDRTEKRAVLLASKARVIASKDMVLIRTEGGWVLPGQFITSVDEWDSDLKPVG